MTPEEAKFALGYLGGKGAESFKVDWRGRFWIEKFKVWDAIDQIDTADEVLDKARTDVLHLAIGRITELMEKVGHPELDFNSGLRSGYLNVINLLLALKTKKEEEEPPCTCTEKRGGQCRYYGEASKEEESAASIAKRLNAHMIYSDAAIAEMMKRIANLEKGKKKCPRKKSPRK